jgi:hypothetical protein
MLESTGHHEIVKVFHKGPDFARRFIESCPDFPLKEQAEQLAQLDVPEAGALALSMASTGLFLGTRPDLGVEVALAAHELLREAADRQGSGIQDFTLSGVALQAVQGLNTLRKYEEALRLASEMLPLYGDEPKNGPSLRLAQILALAGLGELDEARAQLERERNAPHTPLTALLMTQIAASVSSTLSPITDSAPPSADSNYYTKLRDVADKLSATLDTGEMNEWRALNMVRDATSIFLDPTVAKDPDKLRSSLKELEVAAEWLRAHQMIDHESDALWGIYLCYSRLDDIAGAAAALSRLRNNVTAARQLSSSPRQRTEVVARFPHLYAASVAMLSQLERPADVLDVIEEAKANAFVDDVELERDWTTGASADRASRWLPELARRCGTNYVSYFVDSDVTVVVLVAKDGRIHLPGPIRLGERNLQAIVQSAEMWPVDTELPVFDWLRPTLERALVESGSNLCIAAHGALIDLPMQRAGVGGNLLIDAFSVTQTQSAYALAMATRLDSFSASDRLLIVGNIDVTMDPRHARADIGLGTRVNDQIVWRTEPPREIGEVEWRHCVIHLDDEGHKESAAQRLQFLLENVQDFSGSHFSLEQPPDLSRRELRSLTLRFLAKGGSSFLAPSWRVTKEISSVFFRLFYNAWSAHGASRAAALRAASLAIRDEMQGSSMDWAAFELTGDMR